MVKAKFGAYVGACHVEHELGLDRLDILDGPLKGLAWLDTVANLFEVGAGESFAVRAAAKCVRQVRNTVGVATASTDRVEEVLSIIRGTIGTVHEVHAGRGAVVGGEIWAKNASCNLRRAMSSDGKHCHTSQDPVVHGDDDDDADR